jgi:hypothetical protein
MNLAARPRIDRRLARRDGKAGQGDGAHPLAGPEYHARSGGRGLDRGDDLGAMGDVGVVAGILDHPGHGAAGVQAMARQGEGGGQGRMRRLGGGGGAGAGGPSLAKRGLGHGREFSHTLTENT